MSTVQATVKDRPVLFRDEMVRAILAGHKTQTRRLPGPHRYVVGQKLWVRETWAMAMSCPVEPGQPVLYRADAKPIYDQLTWNSAIFMPRWASRITLEVTAVRSERLHCISWEDIRAEGVGEEWPFTRFARLWDSIHGKGAWHKDPLVWVIEFRTLQKPKPVSFDELPNVNLTDGQDAADYVAKMREEE